MRAIGRDRKLRCGISKTLAWQEKASVYDFGFPRRKICASWRASVSVRSLTGQNRPKRPEFSRTELVARHFCPKNCARSSFRAKTARNSHSKGGFSRTEAVARHSRSKNPARSPFRANPMRPRHAQGTFRRPDAIPSCTRAFLADRIPQTLICMPARIEG